MRTSWLLRYNSLPRRHRTAMHHNSRRLQLPPRKRSQRALVRRIYNLVNDMLNTLDSATDLAGDGTVITTAITEATESVQADLEEIQKAADKAAKASALG